MRTVHWMEVTLSATAVLAAACVRAPAAAPAEGVRRIGVYDSRAVAVAWVGSPTFNATMKPLYDEAATAKAAGDAERLKEINAKGEARQRQLHMQGFSTAPVDDILAHLGERLPAIRQTAGVATLVSKWDKAALARYEGAERVDVTMALVDALEPNARQRQCAVSVQQHKPVPLWQARLLKDW
jgi:hypothetical protein